MVEPAFDKNENVELNSAWSYIEHEDISDQNISEMKNCISETNAPPQSTYKFTNQDATSNPSIRTPGPRPSLPSPMLLPNYGAPSRQIWCHSLCPSVRLLSKRISGTKKTTWVRCHPPPTSSNPQTTNHPPKHKSPHQNKNEFPI